MEELYFKQPDLSAEKASRMMEKHLLGEGDKVERINPFKIRLITGSMLWKAKVDLEFSKKEDQLVITIDHKLWSNMMRSGVSILRSNKIADRLKNIARYLFEEPVEA